jgi:hypothetical protein
MRTSDLNQPITANALNESLFKQYNVKINFDKYTREQLEDARNKYRSNVFQTEAGANFNDLLKNENYQKDKFILNVLNTEIKEMLGESIVLAEKAVSKAQQQAAGIALAAKKSGKKPAGKGASAEMSKMSTKELEKFAGTKHKGLPQKKDQKVKEGAKPDFLDMDKDGDKKEPMKKAVADKKKGAAPKKGVNPFAKKDEKVKEGWDDMMKAVKDKEKEKGTGKFDSKKTSTGTVYTRKSSTYDDGGTDSDQKKADKKNKK